MLATIQLFFSRTPEGKEFRADVWETNKNFFVACAVVLAVAAGLGFAHYGLSDMQKEIDAAVAKYDTCEAARVALSDQLVDFERIKSDWIRAEEKAASNRVEIIAANATIKTLEHELDLDDDGVRNLVDKCPDSKGLTDGKPDVNTFGCSELQAADSCAESSDRIPGQFEQYIWSNCSLGAKGVDYTCTGHFDPVEKKWNLTECHETPFILNEDGTKSYGP